MNKSYLSNQIKLMTLNSYDLFNDEEFSVYERVIAIKKEIETKTADAKKKKEKLNEDEKTYLAEQKTKAVKELERLIKSNKETRKVRLKNVLNSGKIQNYITWDDLKLSRKIAEFESEESRLLGIKTDEVTYDKIIMKWKSIDVLEQIVKAGFDMPVLQPDGSVKTIHYIAVTASAGQLRTDKLQCLSEEAWNKIKEKLECGLSWETINEHGGINVN